MANFMASSMRISKKPRYWADRAGMELSVENNSTNFIVLPFNNWDDGGKETPTFVTKYSFDEQMDYGEELVEIADVQGWDTDCDQQLDRTWVFRTDDIVDSGVENIQIILGWDTDAQQQLDRGVWISDKEVMDSQVELVQIALTTGWDNDADQQFNITWQFKTDDVMDQEIEFVQVPRAWDTDAEQQRDVSWRFGQDDILDSGVELIQIALTTGWDNDSDQQILQPLWYRDEQETKEATNYVIIPLLVVGEEDQRQPQDQIKDLIIDEFVQAITVNIPDNSTDQQFDSTWKFSQDDNFDSTVENQPSLYVIANTILMAWRGYWIPKSSMTLMDEEVEYITLPFNDWTLDAEQQKPIEDKIGVGSDQGQDWTQLPITPVVVPQLYAWDTDADNQLDRTWRFQSDDIADGGVEYITLPFNDFTTDTENQIDRTWIFRTDDLSDSQVERIQIALTTGWDNDSDQQLDHTWVFRTDDITDNTVEKIQPYLAWDNDEDQQLDNTWRFSSDDILDSQIERIQIALTTGWDNDADQQSAQPPWYRDEQETKETINYLIIPSVIFAEEDQRQSADLVKEHIVGELIQTFVFGPFDELDNVGLSSWCIQGDSGQDTTNYIILPFNDFTTDAENQKLVEDKIGIGSDQGEDWQHFIIIPPVVFQLYAWDNDQDQQRDNSWRIGDDVSDTSVERIVVLANVWDEDWQFSQQENAYQVDEESVLRVFTTVLIEEDQFTNPGWTVSHVDDERNVQITLPAYPDDDQVLQGGIPVKAILDDEQVEYLAYSPGVIVGWDTDSEQQKLQPEWAKDQQEDREFTNYVIIPQLVDAADEGRSSNQLAIDQVDDYALQFTTQVFGPFEEDQQLVKTLDALDSMGEQEFIQSVVAPYLAFNNDQEHQINQLGWDSQEQENPETTNYIILPFNDFTTDGENQLSNVQSAVDHNFDEAIEYPIVVVIEGWDSDAYQQIPQPLYSIDTEVRDWPNLIIYSPGVLSGWDQVEAQQHAWLPNFTFDSQEEREFINFIVSPLPLLPICAHGIVSLVYLTIGLIQQMFTSSGTITANTQSTGTIDELADGSGEIDPSTQGSGSGKFRGCDDK